MCLDECLCTVYVCVCACIFCHFLTLGILTAPFKESNYMLLFFCKIEEFCPKSDKNLAIL